MSRPDRIMQRILKDVRFALDAAFDRNFERKAFFDRKWPARKIPEKRGSLLIRSGALRRSLHSTIQGTKITWKSYLPYARVHNEGGKIRVTAKMKRFFWFKWYQHTGGRKNAPKGKEITVFYKNMATKRTGSTIQMPKRTFIGTHPQVHRIIRKTFHHHLKHIDQYLKNQFENPKK